MLCKAGEKPDCYYIHIGPDKDDTYSCTSDEDVEMCRAVTARYGVNFEIIDLHKEYWDNVVKYTMDKVSRGYTPNPDVMCNTIIKFGAFYDKIERHIVMDLQGKKVGLIMKCKVVKSKVCNPMGECEIPLFFDRGFVSFAEC